MGGNDAGAETIRDYLKELLRTLIQKEEGFSGKRPFGNSGWLTEELFKALVEGGAVAGRLDSDGYLDWCDTGDAKDALFVAVGAMK